MLVVLLLLLLVLAVLGVLLGVLGVLRVLEAAHGSGEVALWLLPRLEILLGVHCWVSPGLVAEQAGPGYQVPT